MRDNFKCQIFGLTLTPKITVHRFDRKNAIFFKTPHKRIQPSFRLVKATLATILCQSVSLLPTEDLLKETFSLFAGWFLG